MTTSLPSSSPEAPLGGLPAAAVPAALLDALTVAVTPAPAGETAIHPAGQLDFAQVLGANGGSSMATESVAKPESPGWPLTAVAETATAAIPVLATASSTPTSPLVPISSVLRTPAVSVSLRVAASPMIVRPAVNLLPESAPLPGCAAAGLVATGATGEPTPVSNVVLPEAVSAETVIPVAPERSQIEAALALVLPLLSRLPASLPQLREGNLTIGGGAPAALPSGDQGQSAATGSLPEVRITLTHPVVGAVQVEFPMTAAPLSLAEVAAALIPENIVLPQPVRVETPATGRLPQAVQDAVPVQAEIRLSDGTQVVVSLPERKELPHTPAVALPAVIARTEKSAAPIFAVQEAMPAGKRTGEKNFLSAAKPEVTPVRAEAGIGVAQKDHVMPPFAPAPISPVHAAVPVAALVEKIPSESAPELTHAVRGLAHRAVESVTEVVETQAASRLQPVPAVQLRFKVGGEDLSVRVELRGGQVHTEFQTDSADLRGALAQEWRAVTARGDAVVRYLDPVIVPSTPAGQGSGSFSQGQSYGHSSSSHQQQQFRAQAEVFGSVGRSFSAAPPVPEAPAEVTPLVLPSSHRLSAVA